MQKSIRDIAWNVNEETYRADPAISYSTLSRFDREGWRNISHLFDKVEGPALRFGSVVDTLLTDGIDAFNEKYFVCEFPALSENLISIAKRLKENKPNQRMSTILDDEILAVASDFQPNWGDIAKVNHIRTKCETYFNLLALAGDRVIISQKECDDAITCVRELKTNIYTKAFFDENDNRYERVYQLKFKSSYEGIEVRCMFDELIVDHAKKIIYPIDLKTTGHPEEEFDKSFITWRYYIQAQLYTYILGQVIKDDPYFKDFKISNYNFVVINRFTLAPLVWKYEDNFCAHDMVDNTGEVHKNWRKLLVELNYYLNNCSKYSLESTNNKGIMVINNLKSIYDRIGLFL